VEKLDIKAQYPVRYCIPMWLRDEQVRHSTRTIKKRFECYPEGTKRSDPVAIVGFGPSLNDTWEKVRDFQYVISCSGSHKFLVERGIIPTWHIEVDPRAHKVELIGKPHKDVQYLIASSCHPKLLDHLKEFNVSLWHVFSNEEDARRMLPPGEWAVTGGSSVGLRALTIARFLGFVDFHIFGMDGCDGKTGKHAAAHPNQAKGSLPLDYDGVTYYTTPNFLECAKETPHELDRLPDVKATFYGEGLVQHLVRNHKRNPAKGKVAIAMSNPPLISPEHRELNVRLHRENLEYGVGGGHHAALVLKLAQTIRARSILDYGAGKGYLARELPYPIWEYDPAVPGKDESPRTAELLISTDVLEHVEPDKLPFVLDHIRQCMRRVGYFVIHLGPSGKQYTDGRNTHLIQKDPGWWKETLGKFFSVGKTFVAGPEFHAVVGVQHHVLAPGQLPVLLTVDDDGLRDVSAVLEETERAIKKASPLVSIVIPTYNHLDLLKACIESVKAYTDLEDCEVIVMANGCTDGTLDYLKTLSPPFRHLGHEQPMGFTAAVNAGIREARGQYVCLLNNDTVLLPQAKNAWIELLIDPFKKDPKVGITGPVKFHWDLGGIERRAIAFWCAMIPRRLFGEQGLLDEAFSPGMGEDGDFSIKAEMAGYRLVQVPVDRDGEFGKGVADSSFPIYHLGSGTFRDKDYSEVKKRNDAILLARYGRKDEGRAAAVGVTCSIIIPTVDHFEDALKPCVEAVLKYTDLSDKEVIVVANGSPKEAIAWLKTQPVRLIEHPERMGYIRAVNAGIEAATGECVVTLDDDSFLQPQERDQWVKALMAPFREDPKVAASSPFSTVYEDLGHVLHSGCTMYRTSALRKIGLFDEAFNPGYMGDEDLSIRLRKAGYLLAEIPKGHTNRYVDGFFQVQFPVVHTGTVNTMPKHTKDLPLVARNRKLLYERHLPSPKAPALVERSGSKDRLEEISQLSGTAGSPVIDKESAPASHPRISIIIPTYQHLEELLKPCLQSLIKHTRLDDVEVIVVANGCTDGTEDYVRSLGPPFKVVSFPDPLGFTKATNEGLKVATGDYLILYNNDNELLPQLKSQWLDWLLEPFEKDPKTGITGPLQLHDDYADEDVIIGFCLCVSRKALQEAMADTGALLDETFSPGGGEDIDLCCKVRRKGYSVRQVPHEGKLGFSHTNTGEFMIWHRNNQTFKDIPEYTRWFVKRNGFYNMKRYNKNIKLNLGSGGMEYPGYLSVDLHDKRASIIMDVTKLDLDDNSVAEILAIHVFEHLNPYKALGILKEWHRVLKPGGKLIMEMPDIEQLCRRFVTAPTPERYGILNAVYGSVNTTGEGDPSDITSPHLFGWWQQSLRDHLTNAGFVDVVFGPEQYPHPESNLHVEAQKPFGDAMVGLWNYAKCERPVPSGDDTTYRKAMEFLHGCATVEDWGCGTTYAKAFMKGGKYVGIDGSPSKFCDFVTDLRLYKSMADGILIRHVLEHNPDWRTILANAIASFQKKLVLIIFTPFGETTKRIATNWSNIPDLSFRKEDLTDLLKGLPYTEESVRTATQYGVEHLFYITRP
jgi:GT2 family glycosyltransferase